MNSMSICFIRNKHHSSLVARFTCTRVGIHQFLCAHMHPIERARFAYLRPASYMCHYHISRRLILADKPLTKLAMLRLTERQIKYVSRANLLMTRQGYIRKYLASLVSLFRSHLMVQCHGLRQPTVPVASNILDRLFSARLWLLLCKEHVISVAFPLGTPVHLASGTSFMGP